MEGEQFDFWIGEWDITWAENGRGRNVITKILNGKVIQEQFTSLPADGSPDLVGMSVSVYNAQTAQWQQTWVDNQGSYLDFVGGLAGDKMILSRQTVVKGEPVLQRMVWADIEPDSLHWSWERSNDDGKTWQVVWAIEYRRKD
jgi:hypothetical protein